MVLGRVLEMVLGKALVGDSQQLLLSCMYIVHITNVSEFYTQ